LYKQYLHCFLLWRGHSFLVGYFIKITNTQKNQFNNTNNKKILNNMNKAEKLYKAIFVPFMAFTLLYFGTHILIHIFKG
tara:strand:- start:7330 stop:7566 length:237 start_codon:yes stop_codon:yes gene_type:complete